MGSLVIPVRPASDASLTKLFPAARTTAPLSTVLATDLADAAAVIVTPFWELPLIRPLVTDYHQHSVCCPTCCAIVTAPAPPDAASGYGPRITALCGHLHGTYHLSYRAIADLLADVADLPIGLASLVTSSRRLSAALESVDAALFAALQTEPILNLDETSWRERGARCWLWAATSANVSVFRISPSLGRAGLDLLLGASYQGIVTSDRWNAYNRYPDDQRQLCWAHLQRNVRALWEGQMSESAWAEGLGEQIVALFDVWHRYREGKTDPAGLQQEVVSIQQPIERVLREGQTKRWHKIVALGNDLPGHWYALWTFGRLEGVEATNNRAERALRPAVIWRKQCFGTQSAEGSRFVERVLSVVATCRHQGRNVWAFLSEAIVAARFGLPAPALLSTP